ncbi:hypothetical protein D9615_007937 [Tricholomella constricta]|uniref:F-box domain-containing protein n=1 Tax=Tricholomella constricta TaxID=117010 RepID=A0A8H5H267_9AGAR|nr:hypothetical protein D9615_007937 [Tricholomella constricta]
MTVSAHASLDAIPQEVLEHIAYFSATESFLGPPAGLVPLLLTNRKVYSRLTIGANRHLYARIFVHKFDIGPVTRRLGSERTTSCILAAELQRRCFYLKRIRARFDSILESMDADDSPFLHDLLFHAYSMMLENEGKNERQLHEYANMEAWLRDFWFHDLGASRAARYIHVEVWLPDTETKSFAMWLFWFLLRPAAFHKEDQDSRNVLNILTVFALGAHKYQLTNPAWDHFVPGPRSPKPRPVEYYSETCLLPPPPLATPAILSFLTLVNRPAEGVSYSTPLPPSHASCVTPEKLEWECEWERCRSLGEGEFDNILTKSFRPGSIEGVWEGLFTVGIEFLVDFLASLTVLQYTEFTAYASLLAGGDPSVIQKSIVVRHRQTWKLREHHLLAPDPTRSDSGIELDSDSVEPLPAGDPLRSYFPTGTHIRETRDGLEVREPNRKDIMHYQRGLYSASSMYGEENRDVTVQDIIITGEGHSAWGQFNLVGRVRPCDGFVSLSKEYVDGDRGKWLYRGYLVGNVNANLAGRWRDTLTPTDMQGYEGCFAMSRRR